MKRAWSATLLTWWYLAFGLGTGQPQLFGPFLSQGQCQSQADDWTAHGVPSTCLKSEIQGVGGTPVIRNPVVRPRPVHVPPHRPKKPHRPPTHDRVTDHSA